MLLLDPFTPRSGIGPQRLIDGTTSLGRLTTTDEQRAEAIAHMVDMGLTRDELEVSCEIQWSRGEPTILVVTVLVEHLLGQRVGVPDRVAERTLTGSELTPSEDFRFRRLNEEVKDLQTRGML